MRKPEGQTPVLLCPPRLNPDSQGPCFHLTNDGLSYEQTGLYEHFGARAPCGLLLPKHPRDPRSAPRAQHSTHHGSRMGVVPREKPVFYLKA